jgi:mercuric ion transport protein
MTRPSVEKLGTFGAVLTAAACPICFPKLALVGAALGLGALAPFEGYVVLGVQFLFVLAFVGQWVAFRRHHNRWLFALSGVVTLLVFVGYYIFPSAVLLQIALLGLAGASAWLVVALRRCANCAVATP